jgi:hypothetical protein
MEQASVGSVTIPGKLSDPIYVMKQWSSNLLSVPKLVKDNKAVLFHPTHGVVISPAEDMNVSCQNALAIGKLNADDTFTVQIHVDPPKAESNWVTVTKKGRSSQAHLATTREERAGLIFRRVGFTNPNRLIALQQQGARTDLPANASLTDFKLALTEEAYHQARSKAHPHKSKTSQQRSKHPFEKIHIDLKAVNKPSYGGNLYALVIVDDFSRFKFIIQRHTFYFSIKISCIKSISFAKNKMESALKIASEIVSALPRNYLSPESTSGLDGFIHPVTINGTVEQATIEFIIRDFDTEVLKKHEQILEEIVVKILSAYPVSGYEFLVEEQYRNMKSVLDQHPAIVQAGIEAIERSGLKAKVKSIRGGTDGSRLSFMGLPCPNIFAGEHAFHGRQEWVSVQDMQKAVMTIINLARIWEEKS